MKKAKLSNKLSFLESLGSPTIEFTLGSSAAVMLSVEDTGEFVVVVVVGKSANVILITKVLTSLFDLV